ncbi:hypothetical protein CC86DRAFT_349904 [Ophiobolus disseminans]|uniref:Uncharacterized protein n=1 Tax=Ophiobolus disseminans TaxID=1469910 RepID=A0A6A7A0F5_9PLEO|nr:hypothetical protein CC86DRAFT_349904 [Ophiobolus disseminans]
MMHSIRRSCQSALKSPSNVCAYANGSRRAFSRTSAHSRGTLPVFLSPSSPELSALLSTLNSKILLPYHLTPEQQKLVYSLKNKAKLEAEPVEITLGEVTLPLEHINQNHKPRFSQTFWDIVKKSETTDDYENIVRMLEGFVNAGIKVKPGWQEKVIRTLSRTGNHHLLLKALQRPKATGLRMSEPRVLEHVLRAVHDKAALSKWNKEETAKALRLGKQVAELLEDEEHCGGQARGELVSAHDFRGKPIVVALPTELAAVLADRHGGDVDEVKTFAGRLMAALKQDDYDTTLDTIAEHSTRTGDDFKNGAMQLYHVFNSINELMPLVIVWNALRTSRKVLGADMPSADEAQRLETRSKDVLDPGLDAAERLQTSIQTQSQDSIVTAARNTVAMCEA